MNFVEFRDSQSFTFFDAIGVGRHMASHVSQCMASHVCDTWHAMCVTCMAHEEGYKYGVGAVHRSKEQQERK